MITMPETWAWDEYDMLYDTAAEQEAARRAEIVKRQFDAFDEQALQEQKERIFDRPEG